MATTPTVVVPHQSWLSKVGHVFGTILRVITGVGAKVEQIAVPIAEQLLPEYAPAIAGIDVIVKKIIAEAVAAESLQAAVGTATGTGAQKFSQVLANVGPVIDTWITNAFPGAPQLAEAKKANLIQAIIDIINLEVKPATPPTQ